MWKYLKKYRIFAILAPLFMIGEVSMDLLQPRLMNAIVDEGVLGLSNGGVGSMHFIIVTGLKMIGTVALGGTFGILCGVFTNLCSQNFANDVRKACFQRVMSLSIEQTDKFTTGSLITRVTNDVTQVQNMVSLCIRGFVRNAMFLVGGSLCIIRLDPGFGKIVLCAMPLLLVLIAVFLVKITPYFSVLQKKIDTLNSVMQENIAGARVVKAFTKEEHEKQRFAFSNNDLIDTQLKVLYMISYLGPVMSIIMNTAVVAVIYIGGISVKNGTATPGNIMAAITYVTQVLGGVMMIAGLFQNISRGSASAKRLNEVLNCTPTVMDGSFEGETEEKGSVEFKNVSFTYPGSSDPVLKNVSFKVKPGEAIGILGVTGCGKSTLISLIPRFYDPTEGTVLVDGIDAREYKLTALRSKIAIALQKSELFSDTISSNIAWGKPDATPEEIKAAAEIARADEFISATPDGYETVLAERGSSLSGGQKQRTAIARAVIKGAEILIFDDSTSALDLKTEAELNEQLSTHLKGVTRIVIAQRIASVKNADRIAVLEGGSIAAFDTHENLMANCDIYVDIYNSQLSRND